MFRTPPLSLLDRRFCLLFGPLILTLIMWRALFGQTGSDAEPWADPEARIAEHRMGDVTIRVVDGAGAPVAGAKVSVEQTRHAFLFGSNIFKWGLAEREARRGQGTPELQEAYRRRFAELLNFATLPYYWWSYERQQGEPEHKSRERTARWCREQGIRPKGHPLAWNYKEPSWLPDDVETIHRLQLARIEDCVARFKGLIDTWDVVNEATHFERGTFVQRAPKLTRTWEQVGRVEFTRQCFQRARTANPDATLLINDYRIDEAYERLIEGLVDDRGERLYDVIGIQSHMHGGTWKDRKIWEVCERFSRFGVPLHFTEMTVLSGEPGWRDARPGQWPTTPEREAWQAQEVARIYTMLFSHPAVEAITWWDFSDYHAWKNAPAGLLRADMTPKPAYEELMKLIKGKWWTRATLETGADGEASLRGFWGEYRVKLNFQERFSATSDFLLKKSETGQEVVIELENP